MMRLEHSRRDVLASLPVYLAARAIRVRLTIDDLISVRRATATRIAMRGCLGLDAKPLNCGRHNGLHKIRASTVAKIPENVK